METKYALDSSNLSNTILIHQRKLAKQFAHVLVLYMCFIVKNNCYFSFGTFRICIIHCTVFTLFSMYSSVSWYTSLFCICKGICIFLSILFLLPSFQKFYFSVLKFPIHCILSDFNCWWNPLSYLYPSFLYFLGHFNHGCFKVFVS